MSFPANYVIYILTVFLLIDFYLIMNIFLLLYTSEMFFLPITSYTYSVQLPGLLNQLVLLHNYKM